MTYDEMLVWLKSLVVRIREDRVKGYRRARNLVKAPPEIAPVPLGLPGQATRDMQANNVLLQTLIQEPTSVPLEGWRRIKTKFMELDPLDTGLVSVTDAMFIAEWVWGGYHPCGIAIDGEEKREAQQELYSHIRTTHPIEDMVNDQGYYSTNTLAGTRTNELTKNIPMTISTINQEMIQDFGLQTLADLGNYVPSIESEGNSWSTSEIRFRGFLSRNQLYEFLPRYSQVDYYNIERADIIRGANSLIYGQADPGGKVNLISKTANLSKDVNIYTQEFGSFGSFKYNLDVNRVIGDNAAIRIMAVDRSKGYEQEDKFFDFTGVTVEALANVGDKTRLRLHLENTRTKRSRETSALRDNSGNAGFTGMPKNIPSNLSKTPP